MRKLRRFGKRLFGGSGDSTLASSRVLGSRTVILTYEPAHSVASRAAIG